MKEYTWSNTNRVIVIELKSWPEYIAEGRWELIIAAVARNIAEDLASNIAIYVAHTFSIYVARNIAKDMLTQEDRSYMLYPTSIRY